MQRSEASFNYWRVYESAFRKIQRLYPAEGLKIEYEFYDGTCIDTSYAEEAFLHLIGLHKLTDIQIIQFWQDPNNKAVKRRDVIKQIIDERLTDSVIRSSVKFPQIQDRYDYFCYDNLTTLNYTDAVINFNPFVINSTLKADYILYEERPKNEYNHMTIAVDNTGGYRYVESFFHESSTKYITGQKIVKVKRFAIKNADGTVIVEDSFDV